MSLGDDRLRSRALLIVARASSRMNGIPMYSASTRHLLGLVVVCVVEFCERLAGLLLSALLVVFLTERQQIGTGDAVRFADYFQALGYVVTLAGGAVADRIS